MHKNDTHVISLAIYNMRLSAPGILLACGLGLINCSRNGTPELPVVNGVVTVPADAFPADFAITLTQVSVTGATAELKLTTAVAAHISVEYGKISFSENKQEGGAAGLSHTLT